MAKFVNKITGEVVETHKHSTIFKNNGRVVVVDRTTNKELIDSEGNSYELLPPDGGYCFDNIAFGKFSSLPKEEKRKMLKARSKSKEFQANRELAEKRKEIDSQSILPPNMQLMKKEFDASKKNFMLTK
jgi:hypothetical protein